MIHMPVFPLKSETKVNKHRKWWKVLILRDPQWTYQSVPVERSAPALLWVRFNLVFILALQWFVDGSRSSSAHHVLCSLIDSYCLSAGQKMSSKDYKIHRMFPCLWTQRNSRQHVPTTCMNAKVGWGRVSQCNGDSESEERSVEDKKRLLKGFSIGIIFPTELIPTMCNE